MGAWCMYSVGDPLRLHLRELVEESAASVNEVERDVITYVGRRRRRWRLAMLGIVAAVVLAAAGAAFVVESDSSPEVAIAREPTPSEQSEPGTAAPEESEPGSTALSVRVIEVHAGLDGGQDVVIVFNGHLPIDEVTYLEDINHLFGVVHIPHIAYTVQDPSAMRVCDDVHWDFGPGATKGSIDVLIPSQWLESGASVHEVPQRRVPGVRPEDTVDSPGKIVGCGPYKGYVQYSIWSPASDDPADIRVSTQDDPTRLVIAVRPRSG